MSILQLRVVLSAENGPQTPNDERCLQKACAGPLTSVFPYAGRSSFPSRLDSFHIGNFIKSTPVLLGRGLIYPAGAFGRWVFWPLSIAGGDTGIARDTLTGWVIRFVFKGLDRYMNVSLSEMRGLKEGPLRESLMTMSNSLIARASIFKLILCPFLSELWKCSVRTAAAGGSELY